MLTKSPMFVTRGDVAGGGQITIAPMGSTPVRLAFIARDGAGDIATGAISGNYANLREPSGSFFLLGLCSSREVVAPDAVPSDGRNVRDRAGLTKPFPVPPMAALTGRSRYILGTLEICRHYRSRTVSSGAGTKSGVRRFSDRINPLSRLWLGTARRFRRPLWNGEATCSVVNLHRWWHWMKAWK